MRRTKSWALSPKTNLSSSRWPHPRRTDRQRPLKVTAIARANPGRTRDGSKAVPYRDFVGRGRPSGRPLALTCGVAVLFATLAGSVAHTASATTYRLTFPAPEHHWMQVEATFGDLSSAPLELRMSRSSPGRYSLHEFAKNVYDVEAVAPDGRALKVTRPDPYGWTVPEHGPALTVRYRVFGDRVDGTYLAVDATHAHINMPAAIMWARGLDDRPTTVTFDPPAGMHWRVATQLHGDALEFTAPNLQYLMDSPAEFGPISMREFVTSRHRFRFAVHHTGTDA